MLTSTYHAITTNHPSSCRMHCHDEGDRPPATWEHRWRTETMPASAFEYLCEECASELRRREVDRELREIGARVIRVQDLGAALEANSLQGALIYHTTRGAIQDAYTPSPLGLSIMAYNRAREAAHLARLAMGEG